MFQAGTFPKFTNYTRDTNNTFQSTVTSGDILCPRNIRASKSPSFCVFNDTDNAIQQCNYDVKCTGFTCSSDTRSCTLSKNPFIMKIVVSNSTMLDLSDQKLQQRQGSQLSSVAIALIATSAVFFIVAAIVCIYFRRSKKRMSIDTSRNSSLKKFGSAPSKHIVNKQISAVSDGILVTRSPVIVPSPVYSINSFHSFVDPSGVKTQSFVYQSMLESGATENPEFWTCSNIQTWLSLSNAPAMVLKRVSDLKLNGQIFLRGLTPYQTNYIFEQGRTTIWQAQMKDAIANLNHVCLSRIGK